jgi:hypothetical protein
MVDRDAFILRSLGAYSEGVSRGEKLGKLIIEEMHLPGFLYKNPEYQNWYMQTVFEYWQVNLNKKELAMLHGDSDVWTTYATGIEDGARQAWEDRIMGERV